MPAQLGRQCVAQERGRRTPVLPLAVLSAGAFLWILYAWSNNALQVSATLCGRDQSSALLPPWGQFGHGLIAAETEPGWGLPWQQGGLWGGSIFPAPSTELGLKATAHGKKEPLGHLWHWGVWKGWESKGRSSRCSAAMEGRAQPPGILHLVALEHGPAGWTWLNKTCFAFAFRNPRVQLSARKELIAESLSDVLEENGIHGLKREEILQLTRQAMETAMKNSYWMPNWALKSLGATVDAERTTKSYGGKAWISPLFSSVKPPETLLQPDVSAGSCWAFQGSRGHAVIQLPENIWPTAVTMWHVSKAVSPSGDVSSAPRDFAILGVDEDENETLLGSFIYDVDGEIAQTFHVQVWQVQGGRAGLPARHGKKELSCPPSALQHGRLPRDHC
ncbi:sperm-associated antigen 4 protein-like [Excalfactoria chinensis]|uniref:sperm-associated antigen 4 protein-like n=1 Tax=Excalfactoria chinensis TaxID=46218 RepID=UPI003B3B1D9E